MQLASNGHDDDIGLRDVVVSAADDNCRTLLESCLTCERKAHQHKVAELIVHRTHRLPGCSTPRRTRPHWLRLLPARGSDPGRAHAGIQRNLPPRRFVPGLEFLA